MEIIALNRLQELFEKYKTRNLSGRWIRFKDLKPCFEKIHTDGIEKKEIGLSELGTSIYSFQIGSGEKKILIWSQMHGNESTGTKAIFDLLFTLSDSKKEIIVDILKNCTIVFVPMLNPDGAEKYSRLNADEIDLNRDAVALKAKESNILRDLLEKFNPDFCFNLHDQRTIFGVEGTGNPASISFLAPSEEINRKITEGRKETMNVIVAMNKMLQHVIPNKVGRYTDEFYPTATGDNFQKLGYNTILIEAGHYPDDYEREKVRAFNYYALIQGLHHISTTQNFKEYQDYFKIPNNIKSFFDIILMNEKNEKIEAFQYTESIKNSTFAFEKIKVEVGDLDCYFGHRYIYSKM